MRIVSYLDAGMAHLGLREGEELVSLTAMGLPNSLSEFLRGGPGARDAALSARRHATTRRPLGGITYRAPLDNPAKAIAVGLNYRDHASESNFKAPDYPVLFQRYPSSWVAHEEPLLRPYVSTQFDYEGELVIVIGKPGRYIPRKRALGHVAGYSLFNDGSIRDYQFKSAQWMMGKNFDKSGAFGPEFVSADELPVGARGLQLTTRLNGALMQRANTNDMIFDVPTLVSVCSDAMTLDVGDIIISGTPAGVGFARKPPVFMKAGDVCQVEVEGLGILSNPVADDSEQRQD
jgi:2-keto-4-pentenoate hydratase/2-oxohepta-3-ene-1,7-dioic acid hydratase in catechol pathway